MKSNSLMWIDKQEVEGFAEALQLISFNDVSSVRQEIAGLRESLNRLEHEKDSQFEVNSNVLKRWKDYLERLLAQS